VLGEHNPVSFARCESQQCNRAWRAAAIKQSVVRNALLHLLASPCLAVISVASPAAAPPTPSCCSRRVRSCTSPNSSRSYIPARPRARMPSRKSRRSRTCAASPVDWNGRTGEPNAKMATSAQQLHSCWVRITGLRTEHVVGGLLSKSLCC
jgi:hypothetical protein